MDGIFEAVCFPGGFCDTAGVWLGALLTLLVWSYLVRDTRLFRIAASVLVGTAIGLGSAIAIRAVLWDQLLAPMLSDIGNLFANTWLLIVPLVLGISLLFKLSPKWNTSTFSNLGMAYLFGAGAALAIGGALSGTLVPQLAATAGTAFEGGDWAWLNGGLLVVGTLGALLSFAFVRGGDKPWQRAYGMVLGVWGWVGRSFIMVAFGALFAGIVAARVSTLVGQLYFLLHDWLGIVR